MNIVYLFIYSLANSILITGIFLNYTAVYLLIDNYKKDLLLIIITTVIIIILLLIFIIIINYLLSKVIFTFFCFFSEFNK